MKDKKGCR